MKKIYQLFIFLICVFAQTPALKIANMQIIEFLLSFGFFGGIIILIGKKFRLSLEKKFQIYYFTLFLLIIILCWISICILNRPFFPPSSDLSFLKQPGILSFAKVYELLLMIVGSLYLLINMRDNSILANVMRYTMYISVVIALYTIISWILSITLGDSFGATIKQGHLIRGRGFFVEGGNYGLFQVSAIIITYINFKFLSLIGRKVFFLLLTIQVAGFLVAFSKSGILLFILLFLIPIFYKGVTSKKAIISFLILIVISIPAINFLKPHLIGYYRSYKNIMLLYQIEKNAENVNLFYGRVAGLNIIPAMVKAHPWTGIGIGNYSLVRNNPLYLNGLPSVKGWDLPGLGLFGTLAEFGIPLFLLFMLCLLYPIKLAWSSSPDLFTFSTIQLFSFLLGVQITFFYPWLIGTIMMVFIDKRKDIL